MSDQRYAIIRQYQMKDDVKNVHICQVEYDYSNKKWILGNTQTVGCKLHAKEEQDIEYDQVFPVNKGEIRQMLAEWQNEGFEMCGNCVAHFYSDGI